MRKPKVKFQICWANRSNTSNKNKENIPIQTLGTSQRPRKCSQRTITQWREEDCKVCNKISKKSFSRIFYLIHLIYFLIYFIFALNRSFEMTLFYAHLQHHVKYNVPMISRNRRTKLKIIQNFSFMMITLCQEGKTSIRPKLWS